jgi:hypothetical protein
VTLRLGYWGTPRIFRHFALAFLPPANCSHAARAARAASIRVELQCRALVFQPLVFGPFVFFCLSCNIFQICSKSNKTSTTLATQYGYGSVMGFSLSVNHESIRSIASAEAGGCNTALMTGEIGIGHFQLSA